MSKTISDELKDHLAGPVTNIAFCVKLTLNDDDSTVLAFTDHSQDIVYDSVTYKSEYGNDPTSITSTLGLAVDNFTATGPYNSAGIVRTNILKWKYDYAAIEAFFINYKDTSQGIMNLPVTGWLGQQQIKDEEYEFEYRSLAQRLQQPIGILCTPGCRHIVGDSNCGVTLTDYTVTKTVTGVTDNSTFTSTTAGGSTTSGYYSYGIITWTSGNNDELQMEIKSQTYSGGTYTINLVLPMPADIAADDTFTMSAGCNKSLTICSSKFSNVARFGGFPHVPGDDAISKYPDAK